MHSQVGGVGLGPILGVGGIGLGRRCGGVPPQQLRSIRECKGGGVFNDSVQGGGGFNDRGAGRLPLGAAVSAVQWVHG